MASAWGKAWGKAWGFAWGRVEKKKGGAAKYGFRQYPVRPAGKPKETVEAIDDMTLAFFMVAK